MTRCCTLSFRGLIPRTNGTYGLEWLWNRTYITQGDNSTIVTGLTKKTYLNKTFLSFHPTRKPPNHCFTEIVALRLFWLDRKIACLTSYTRGAVFFCFRMTLRAVCIQQLHESWYHFRFRVSLETRSKCRMFNPNPTKEPRENIDVIPLVSQLSIFWMCSESLQAVVALWTLDKIKGREMAESWWITRIWWSFGIPYISTRLSEGRGYPLNFLMVVFFLEWWADVSLMSSYATFSECNARSSSYPRLARWCFVDSEKLSYDDIVRLRSSRIPRNMCKHFENKK
jgi:hypothetical protein